jgi:diadenosine tetraphosphate (Ap4A) HIT family hydrolase
MNCPLCQDLELARAGTHPRLVAELKRCFVFLSENQGMPGWCVLVLKRHEVHLADMSLDEQMAIFREVAQVGNGIRAALGPDRINYECLGNQVNHVHWHVIPRYYKEQPLAFAHPDPDLTRPVFGFTQEQLSGSLSPMQLQQITGRLRATMGK